MNKGIYRDDEAGLDEQFGPRCIMKKNMHKGENSSESPANWLVLYKQR